MPELPGQDELLSVQAPCQMIVINKAEERPIEELPKQNVKDRLGANNTVWPPLVIT